MEYWYAYGMLKGKFWVLGPFTEESECFREGFGKLQGSFRTKALETSQLSEATRQLKALWFRETGSVDVATERAKHVV